MDAITNEPGRGGTDLLTAGDPAVVADEALIEAVRAGRRGVDDADPLVRLLARWREAVRRPRRRDRRRGGPLRHL